MNAIKRVLTRPITSTRSDATFASIAAYLAALLILGIGFVGIGSLKATEVEIFLAALGVVTLGLLFVMFGLLIEVHKRLQGQASIEPEPQARA